MHWCISAGKLLQKKSTYRTDIFIHRLYKQWTKNKLEVQFIIPFK